MIKIITNEKIFYINIKNISTIDITNQKITFKKDSHYLFLSEITNMEEILKELKIN